MIRYLVIAILVFVQDEAFCQEHISMDSLQRAYWKAQRKNLRLLKDRNDSTVFITGYDKKTFQLLGYQILVMKKELEFPRGQFALQYYPDGMILLNIWAERSQGKEMGHARYLFKNGVLISKEEDKLIDSDYSLLYPVMQSYRPVAIENMKEKFGKVYFVE